MALMTSRTVPVLQELVHTRRGEGELLSYSTTLHVLSLADEASVPLNPCSAFGGHADVALLGWLPETLPPSDEAENLRQASAQFMQLHRPAVQDDGKKAVVKVRPVRLSDKKANEQTMGPAKPSRSETVSCILCIHDVFSKAWLVSLCVVCR